MAAKRQLEIDNTTEGGFRIFSWQMTFWQFLKFMDTCINTNQFAIEIKFIFEVVVVGLLLWFCPFSIFVTYRAFKVWLHILTFCNFLYIIIWIIAKKFSQKNVMERKLSFGIRNSVRHFSANIIEVIQILNVKYMHQKTIIDFKENGQLSY